MASRAWYLALLLAVFGVVSALLVLPLLQYILAAAILAFVLYPLYERLLGSRVSVRGQGFVVGPRLSGLLITGFGIVAVILPLLVLSLVLLQTALSLVEELAELELTERYRELVRDLGVDDRIIEEIETFLRSEVEAFLERAAEMAFREIVRFVDVSIRVGIGLLVLVFLLYYFLVDGRRLLGWLAMVSPIEEEVVERLFGEIDAVTWAVMKSHVFVALLEGILGGIGLYVLGVPNVAFWTVVMVVVSFLPAIGIWLIWAPAVGYLVVIGEPISAVLLLVYGITVLSVIDNYVRALLVDMDAGVHPALVLVGVIGGIYVFGILGLFIGPILLAVFKAIAEVAGEHYSSRVADGETTSTQ